ncbi:HTTM domain-containing protein [Chondrinema litorale]|uniref:HTTM domain-containing protein n=1 Tax=Chondrinema litorale TaxID=2994555 RepID=UPI002542722E|nr:HTTM domain-containing protein [Chondrinema litorale]UZR96930.1 HTTM domain-containing protein [Chondrinema litorale]
MKEKINKLLFKEVSIAPLAFFRVLFGAVMLWSILRFILNGWIYQQYIQPGFFFSYYGFEWVKPLPAFAMYLVFTVMAISAFMVMLGWFYKVSISLFFVLFSYVELIDKTNYLNHYYFISLVAFLLFWVPAHRYFSIDVIRKPSILKQQVPRWVIAIFQFQLGIVYVYAGIAKLNPDWLFEAMPLKIWLPVHSDFPVLGKLFQYEITAYIFSWFGAIYDLTIPFFLLSKFTRKYAYLAVVAFHVITWLLFPIGMFPFIMIGATLIFFPAKFHQNIIYKVQSLFSLNKKSFSSPSIQPQKALSKKLVITFLVGYCLLQLVFPWRFMFYPGHLFWTEEGYRFSWRVMLMEKAGYVVFHVEDKETGRKGDVYARDYLTPNQEKMMATQPDMILQFAHYIRDEYKQQGITEPAIYAEAYVTLNGEGSRLFIDPTIDLSNIKESFEHKWWVLPYQKTLAAQ